MLVGEQYYNNLFCNFSGGKITWPEKNKPTRIAQVNPANLLQYPWLFTQYGLDLGMFRYDLFPISLTQENGNQGIYLALHKKNEEIQRELTVRKVLAKNGISTFPINYIWTYKYNRKMAMISELWPEFVPFHYLLESHDANFLQKKGLSAIQALHEIGIYHGEPRIWNLAMNPSGEVIIHDFADAQIFNSEDEIPARLKKFDIDKFKVSLNIALNPLNRELGTS